MSKTLEELGYKIIFHNEDRLMYRKDDKKKITFTGLKNVAFADVDMEELKAINKKCEELGWLDDKNLEELGYKKEEYGKSYDIFSRAISETSRKLYEEDIEAIDTVLTALDERYNKGYQDGFKQAKFDCEMDKLDGR